MVTHLPSTQCMFKFVLLTTPAKGGGGFQSNYLNTSTDLINCEIQNCGSYFSIHRFLDMAAWPATRH